MRSCAASVTCIARNIATILAQATTHMGDTVIYGDADSVFITNNTDSVFITNNTDSVFITNSTDSVFITNNTDSVFITNERRSSADFGFFNTKEDSLSGQTRAITRLRSAAKCHESEIGAIPGRNKQENL